MTTTEYIDLNIEAGHKIIQTENCHWYITDEGYAHSFPPLDNVNPSHTDFTEIFRKNIRFVLFRRDLPDQNTFEYVFKGNSYGLELFDSKTRNQIRKGLKSCKIKGADKDMLITQGLSINRETLSRQGRSVPYLDREGKWEKYISHFFDKKDVIIKCALVDDEIAGYAIFLKVNEKYIIQHPFRKEKYSSANPMNALLYSFINDIIEKEGFIEITYGLASFSDKPGLDKFKKAMLFSEKEATRLAVIPARYNIIFNPCVNSLVKLISGLGIKNNYSASYQYLYRSNILYKKHYHKL